MSQTVLALAALVLVVMAITAARQALGRAVVAHTLTRQMGRNTKLFATLERASLTDDD